jgi:hydrogenase-4 component F
MKELSLVLIPFAGAAVATWLPDNRSRPWVLPVFAFLHLLMALWLLLNPPQVGNEQFMGFDAIARAVLPCVSILFFCCSLYALSYLKIRHERDNRIFCALLLCILGLMSAAHMSRHLGLLWIATEGVTLAAIPLLHFAGTARAYEATWKFLLVSGTGIALSLLGSFCLGYASLHGGGNGDLFFASLVQQGNSLTRPWVLISWVLILVGYGTKMGLAPMHTWKPDAYGEAPGVVGAILAGGVTTVAFTAILRVKAVVYASGNGVIADRSLLFAGLFSMLIAALFLLGTRDFKRMLAYSSVEHMGILSVGAALGPLGMGAAFFHVWANALTKGALFLSAGTLRRRAGARSMDEVAGMAKLAPMTSGLFVAGLFAITACPPFAPFFSELRILRCAFSQGQLAVVAWFLLCLLFAFFGLSRLVFAIVDGSPSRKIARGGKSYPESKGVLMPALLLLLLSLWLGLFTPAVLEESWAQAAIQIFPQP